MFGGMTVAYAGTLSAFLWVEPLTFHGSWSVTTLGVPWPA